MNGAQDLGGMHGFGPVEPEPDEPVFHAAWERQSFALTLAMGFTGQWNIDASRHARESLPPAEYLSSSYYRIWARGLETLLLERGLVSEEELAGGKSLNNAGKIARILMAPDVQKVLAHGGPAERETNSKPVFAEGAHVRAINMNPAGHTRLPRYVRGKRGIVERIHGHHVFPDANARGDGECPRWLYSVRFEAGELWGPDGRSSDAVFVDLWESYLNAE